MHLCIDQGNSSIKVGIFQGNTLIESIIFKSSDKKDIILLFEKYPVQATIYSSVALYDEIFIKELQRAGNFVLELTHETPIPIKNEYDSPETLGKDRLAAVVGAWHIMPNNNLLVIDAGSAITFDFIDNKGIYRGGNISPGVDLRLRGLHEFTQRLPLVSAPKEEVAFIGKNTQSAILAGVVYGIVFEMDGYIDSLKNQYADLSTFLTGGSTFYFANKLKNAIFANENLVLIGLNRILQHNVQN